jgi:hypothetical protein
VRRISEESGIFFVNARGPWDALGNSQRVVSAVLKAGAQSRTVSKSVTAATLHRKLPGCASGEELLSFRRRALDYGITSETIELVVRRWAGRVRYLGEDRSGYVELIPGVLQGEVELAVFSDHAVSALDVLQSSLGLNAAAFAPEYLEIIEEFILKCQR